ncbi:MAG: hypothetical protein ACM3O3_12800 [Syntrophothermus sp.]
MGAATDYGQIIKILVNDEDLKTLMDIPVNEKTNYGLLTQKYFLQTFVSDEFTGDGVCRLLVRAGMSIDTNNEYVKRQGLIIEVYVPKSKDLMSGFETRTNKISDQLVKTLNRIYVNDNKLIYQDSYETMSGSNNYKRQYVKFEYKKVIH